MKGLATSSVCRSVSSTNYYRIKGLEIEIVCLSQFFLVSLSVAVRDRSGSARLVVIVGSHLLRVPCFQAVYRE